jgi:hypothetical protein
MIEEYSSKDLDHPFDSPTYAEAKAGHLKQHINRYK